ncbi:hypothetical protein DITRI_Ditri04bG0104100 [Diplodiscus trichospermus]
MQFVYYLFDRHWSRREEEWRHIVDFASSFGINRYSLLESFTFCLLDDHADEALLESYQLLREISGPASHPQIVPVLLERHNPEAAHMVLRWSGRDYGSHLVSLSETVTIVRVKVELGLLTEAFTYPQMLCTKVREKKFKHGPSGGKFEDLKGDCRSWMNWIEVLVTEFCCLCIRRNVVDRIIELPWNSDEEKHIHKCLLDCATVNPSTTMGSLLVVFYFRNCCQKAALSDIVVASGQGDDMSARSDLPEVQEPKSASLLVSSTSDSIVLRSDHMATPLRPAVVEIPKILGGSVNNPCVEAGNHGSSLIFQGKLFTNAARISNVEVGKKLKFDDIASPGIRRVSTTYDRDDGHWNVPPTEELMDVSRSLEKRSFEDRNANGGPRWRSDETSDEEEQSPNKTIEVGATPIRGLGRRRFGRR